MKRTVFAILFFITMPLFSQSFSNPYSPQAIKAFADDLYLNGFFKEAAGEYKRHLFMTEQPDTESFFALANIYRSEKDHQSLEWMDTQFSKKLSPQNLETFNLIIAEDLFLQRNAGKTDELLKTREFSEFSRNLVQLAYYINMKDIYQAKATINKMTENKIPLQKMKTELDSYKEKSPWLALSLSAIIPGSGKWYGENFTAGLNSLLSIATLSTGTIYFGNKYGITNWRTLATGTMAAVSYVTELYGSYKNIQRINQARYMRICAEMEALYKSQNE